ncbi:hypothetical protein AaE_006781 [Aphanomyces astaci]|uniref:Uncharacterized protein n=1 Tax=Aphanomyces astaci TaxID=112090 RepID=A0A6A5ADL5_APHAT|nr:hypothetical protein AaE_006781 [Aphanomyces astaci]
MKATMLMLTLSAATLATAGRIHETRGDVKFVDTLSAIHSYEKQHPNVAAVHDEVRRALMDESSSGPVESDFNNAQERYIELKKLRVQVEMATSHCQDDECYALEQQRLFDYLKRAGKFKGELPPIGSYSRKRASFPLPEFPSAEEPELEAPVQRPPPRYTSPQDDMTFDDDDDDDNGEGFDLEDGDFVDEFAYDKSKQGKGGYYPSQKEMEEQIRRQVAAHLMGHNVQGKLQGGVPEGATSPPVVCLPFTSICDLNIVAGIIYTILVGLVVSVLSQAKSSRGPKKPKKK